MLIFHKNTGRNFLQGTIPAFNTSEIINDDDASDDEWPPTASPTASPSVTPTQAPISLPTVDSPGCRFERLKGMLFSISNKLAVKNEPTYRLVSLSLCK